MSTPKICAKRENSTDTFFCPGCETSFCKEDYQSHRNKVTSELERLVTDRNDLQSKINQSTPCNHSKIPLLTDIDEWQRTTIEKVKQVAEQTRQQVIKLLQSREAELKSQFDRFSQDVMQLRETENFVEQNMQRLEQTIDQLKQDLRRLNQASDIELQMEKSNQIVWDSLIYAEEKPNQTRKQETQQEVNEPKKPVVPSYRKELICKGHACLKCGDCCDWYYTEDHYTKRHGATCNRDYVSQLFLDDAPCSIYDDTLYSDDDSLYHGRNVICQCDDHI